jgi:hypothetical protein
MRIKRIFYYGKKNEFVPCTLVEDVEAFSGLEGVIQKYGKKIWEAKGRFSIFRIEMLLVVVIFVLCRFFGPSPTSSRLFLLKNILFDTWVLPSILSCALFVRMVYISQFQYVLTERSILRVNKWMKSVIVVDLASLFPLNAYNVYIRREGFLNNQRGVEAKKVGWLPQDKVVGICSSIRHLAPIYDVCFFRAHPEYHNLFYNFSFYGLTREAYDAYKAHVEQLEERYLNSEMEDAQLNVNLKKLKKQVRASRIFLCVKVLLYTFALLFFIFFKQIADAIFVPQSVKESLAKQAEMFAAKATQAEDAGFFFEDEETKTILIKVDPDFSWKLSTCVVPKRVRTIRKGAFTGCQRIECISIPEGVTQIEDGTFIDCQRLQSIRFPASIKEINDSFSGCKQLFSFDFLGKPPKIMPFKKTTKHQFMLFSFSEAYHLEWSRAKDDFEKAMPFVRVRMIGE